MINEIRSALREAGDEEKAAQLQRFLKPAPANTVQGTCLSASGFRQRAA